MYVYTSILEYSIVQRIINYHEEKKLHTIERTTKKVHVMIVYLMINIVSINGSRKFLRGVVFRIISKYNK